MCIVRNDVKLFRLFIQHAPKMHVILQHFLTLIFKLHISFAILVSQQVFGLIAFFGVGVALIEDLEGLR